jgi:hypothetical protein
MVPSHPRLLRTGVSVTQPYSDSRPEPPVAGCRLGTMVRSRERTRVRRAHRFGCHEHGIRFGSRWPSATSGPRRCPDCGPSCSTRPRDPRATENVWGLGELPVKLATQRTPSSNLLHDITGFQAPNWRIRVELNRYAVWGGASSPVGLDTSRAAPPLHISLSPSVARSLARAWTGCLQHIPCRKGAFHDTASQTDD